MIHDISPLISPRLAIWPGDTPLTREVLCDLARGEVARIDTLAAQGVRLDRA